MEIVFDMLFPKQRNVGIYFNNREFMWRLYTTVEVFLTTRYIKFSEKKNFAIVAFYLEDEIFIVCVMFFTIFDEFYHSRKP